MNIASIIVDIQTMRCNNCKVAVHDKLAKACEACGATFDRVVSNHVGLADKLNREREEAAKTA